MGLATGLACTAFILSLVLQGAAKPSAVVLISRAINETVFPIGCAMVLYASEAVGRREA